MQPFYVYILLCSDDSYYIGHTDDIEKRIAEHVLGNYCGYTAKRLPIQVVYLQEFMTRGEAIEIEQQLKQWSRKKKAALISGDWNGLKQLAKKKFK